MVKSVRDMTKDELAVYLKKPADMVITSDGGVVRNIKPAIAAIGDNSIKAITASIIQAAQDLQLATFDKAFFIGKQLSELEDIAHDPKCGVEGKTWKNRYKAILDADILDRHHGADINLAERTLRYYKQSYDTYAPYINDLRGKVSFRTLRDLTLAKYDKVRPGIIDDIINGQPVNMAEIKASVGKPKAKPAPFDINKVARDLGKRMDREQLIRLAQKLLEDLKG